MRILREKQRLALWEVVCMGQQSSLYVKPTRAERKAAKWAGRVLEAHKDDRLVALEDRISQIKNAEVTPEEVEARFPGTISQEPDPRPGDPYPPKDLT